MIHIAMVMTAENKRGVEVGGVMMATNSDYFRLLLNPPKGKTKLTTVAVKFVLFSCFKIFHGAFAGGVQDDRARTAVDGAESYILPPREEIVEAQRGLSSSLRVDTSL